ncbi:uncharacterized protein LOC131251495 isoform X2 [Magnolia sinica]|uniref:uncharacterized protein LOC131251495 isoform X2 n=1 Tax=Magnolia sinica TaxID=86752 RepID=UPI0026594885|nr:uncharacterized protein LOC131251495 isoform X2 [Magnolia sinica]
MDDIDNIPLSKRMRMLLADRPSGSSSGSGSSGKVPKCCVDEDVIEEGRPSKVAARGSIPAVVDRAYIPLKNDPCHQRMGSRRVQASESSLPEHSSSSESLMEEETATPRTSLLKFSSRPVVCERKVLHNCLRGFPVLELLVQIGWEPVLSFGGPVHENLVRMFFARCRKPHMDPLSFDVDYNGKVTHVTPTLIGRLIQVPPLGYVPPGSNLPRKAQRLEWTRFLCGGRNVAWFQGNALRASEMTAQFRILHLIFVSNVYPRLGNRSELTPFMAETLYRVGIHQPMCLPSLIMRQIIYVLTSSHSLALPFGNLICKLARECGLPATSERPILKKMIDLLSIRRMKLLPQESAPSAPSAPQIGVAPRTPSPLEASPASPPMSSSAAPPPIDVAARLAAIEERQMQIYRYLQSLASCFRQQGHDVPSPSNSP